MEGCTSGTKIFLKDQAVQMGRPAQKASRVWADIVDTSDGTFRLAGEERLCLIKQGKMAHVSCGSGTRVLLVNMPLAVVGSSECLVAGWVRAYIHRNSNAVYCLQVTSEVFR